MLSRRNVLARILPVPFLNMKFGKLSDEDLAASLWCGYWKKIGFPEGKISDPKPDTYKERTSYTLQVVQYTSPERHRVFRRYWDTYYYLAKKGEPCRSCSYSEIYMGNEYSLDQLITCARILQPRFKADSVEILDYTNTHRFLNIHSAVRWDIFK